MTATPYQLCLESMFKLRRFGIKLGLETVQDMLARVKDPHRHLRTLHIAGTNGKGSVATMLASILISAGFKVGRYTSPHLERFNERICIGNEPVSDEQVVDAYEQVRAAGAGLRQPTFFEYTTVMAFWIFAQEQVDWAVIETGMGGRMDATNVVHPAVSIITNISLEHKSYLGSTIAAIAGEKAGIIKRGTPLVTAVAQPAARKVIMQQAAENNADVYRNGYDFKTRREKNAFSYYGMDNRWWNLELSLQGMHQIQNAALALATCELLNRSRQLKLDQSSIRKGLKESRWPGRLEVISDRPLVVLDGAHNLASARALSNHLKSVFSGRRITLVVGILNDKPYQRILRYLMGPCSRVIITQPKIDRAISAQELAQAAKMFDPNVEIVPDVGQAARYAISESREDDIVCIAGSLYVVGEARTALLNQNIAPANRFNF